jgi:hypothetical protein
VALGLHPRERKSSATCALGRPQRPRMGRPSARWRHACRPGLPPASRPGRLSAGGSSPRGLVSKLGPLPPSPTTHLSNCAVHSESSHSLQWKHSQCIHSATQCNPRWIHSQWTVFHTTVKNWSVLVIVNYFLFTFQPKKVSLLLKVNQLFQKLLS